MHTIFVKNNDDILQVKVNENDWKLVDAKSVIGEQSGRFTIKCEIDGIFSTFSTVISPEQIAIFNEVIIIYFHIIYNY